MRDERALQYLRHLFATVWRELRRRMGDMKAEYGIYGLLFAFTSTLLALNGIGGSITIFSLASAGFITLLSISIMVVALATAA